VADVEARLDQIERCILAVEGPASDRRWMVAQLRALLAERDRLRAALEKYGRHESACHEVELTLCMREGHNETCRCTCGLDDALSGRGGA
jgi:hypothetical protein